MADATDPGVSQEDNEKLVAEARDTANGQRLEAMQELAEKRRETRDAELAAEGQDVIDTTGEPEQEEPEDKDDSKEEVSQETETKEETEKEEYVTLKVNGKEEQVPLSKVLDAGTRTLQKETAADARLQEATQLLAEAKKEREAATPPSSDVDSSPSTTVDAEILAKKLIDGDIEEVKDAIQTLTAGRDSATVATQVQEMDRSQVFGFVQDALHLEQAMTKFKESPENGGFGDLYNDPTLRKMVMDKEEELVNNGDERGYLERLTDAAAEVRTWRDDMLKTAGVNVADFDKRKQEKLKADAIPDITGGRETRQGEQKPKSRSEVRKNAVEKMAASRGQTID